jgi:hypothetical protein
MVVPAAIETALKTAVGAREVELDSADPALKVMTRRLKDANVYLFFNEGVLGCGHEVTMKAPGMKVEVWDPATGFVSPVASTEAKGRVTVKIELKPYETELLLVR